MTKQHLPNPYPHSLQRKLNKKRGGGSNVELRHEFVRRNKSEMVRWAVHVARFREVINLFGSENLKGKDQLEDISVDGRKEVMWFHKFGQDLFLPLAFRFIIHGSTCRSTLYNLR
jgi:hypothetical protein